MAPKTSTFTQSRRFLDAFAHAQRLGKSDPFSRGFAEYHAHTESFGLSVCDSYTRYYALTRPERKRKPHTCPFCKCIEHAQTFALPES